MKRKIVSIDRDKCNGCGLCAEACHEGAIAMIDGKAELIRDDYCDGLGDCLPACPADAISIEEREAADYSPEAVEAKKKAMKQDAPEAFVCPGSRSRSIGRDAAPSAAAGDVSSQLSQWPVQIKLAPVRAPYFDGADLLVAADCTAYAYGDFHNRFIRNRVTLIGCPKLDSVDYSEKLAAIIAENDIKSVTVVRMEVPCCGGIEFAVMNALKQSGKFIPWHVVVVSTDGRIISE